MPTSFRLDTVLRSLLRLDASIHFLQTAHHMVVAVHYLEQQQLGTRASLGRVGLCLRLTPLALLVVSRNVGAKDARPNQDVPEQAVCTVLDLSGNLS